jgi:hypothetical protein
VDVEIRFLTGQKYCCAEFGCHLPRHSDALIALSPSFPANLQIRWHCCVEKGAFIASQGEASIYVESEAYDYVHITARRYDGRMDENP